MNDDFASDSHDLRQPVMCNMSKSMRLSRIEYKLCSVKNTNNPANRKKNNTGMRGSIHEHVNMSNEKNIKMKKKERTMKTQTYEKKWKQRKI